MWFYYTIWVKYIIAFQSVTCNNYVVSFGTGDQLKGSESDLRHDSLYCFLASHKLINENVRHQEFYTRWKIVYSSKILCFEIPGILKFISCVNFNRDFRAEESEIWLIIIDYPFLEGVFKNDVEIEISNHGQIITTISITSTALFHSCKVR